MSLVKKMITIASQEAKEAESKSDTARSGLLNMALGFSTQKLRLVTDGAVTGSDVGGEMRQALNVLLNTIYR